MQGQSVTKESPTTQMPLLNLSDLWVSYKTDAGIVNAVNGIDIEISAGETLAIVGESGSGKSVTARAIMGMIRDANAVVSGSIRYRGRELLGLRNSELKKIRGQEISLVSQEILGSLNPVMTVGDQIAEMFKAHRGLSWKEGRDRAVELMDQLAIPSPAKRVSEYPHQLSGGMGQRILIAMAIALEPAVLIADEPTTALDVTVQAQIMELLAKIQREKDMALILITHDAGVVAEVADRIAVMYGGSIVETGPTKQVYSKPGHPYMQGLLSSMPQLGPESQTLQPIPGSPPDPADLPPGCAFSPRCPMATSECRAVIPVLTPITDGRASACFHSDEMWNGEA